MRSLSGVLASVLVLGLAGSVVRSDDPPAGKEEKPGEAYGKLLDETVAAAKKFLEEYPDSAEAGGALTLLVFTYATAPHRWLKEREKDAQALLDDLEKKEHHLAGPLQQPLAQIRMMDKPAPKIDTVALDGKPVKLEDYKGKVLLIDFWATWCGPCVAELPEVKALYEKFKEKGFDILGVSLDEEKEALEEFLKSEKVPWRQIFDGKGWESALVEPYGVQGIPMTFLVDGEGKVIELGLRGKDLESFVAGLMEGEEEGG